MPDLARLVESSTHDLVTSLVYLVFEIKGEVRTRTQAQAQAQARTQARTLPRTLEVKGEVTWLGLE